MLSATRTIQDTSVMQFNAMQPILGDRQKEVLWGFKLLCEIEGWKDATDSEVATILGHRENRNFVSPRRFELEEMKKLIYTTKRTCRVTGRVCMAFRVVKDK